MDDERSFLLEIQGFWYLNEGFNLVVGWQADVQKLFESLYHEFRRAFYN